MKKIQTLLLWLGLISGFLLQPLDAMAAGAAPAMSAPPGLSLLEIKITGDEFIVLQNNTAAAITDTGSYWLTAYNNADPLAPGVSVSSQQLPTASLQPGQTLLLSANPMVTCGASVAGKLSLGLTDSGGFLQLTQSSLNSAGAVVQSPGDLVSWSTTANGIIQNIPSNTKDTHAAYYRYLSGDSYFWQQADLDTANSCQLDAMVAGGSGSSSAVTPLTLAATSPPATILGTANDTNAAPPANLPPADVGLQAPQISELLPNPSGTGNDASDEFIELYNPNSKVFDLSGFSLQTGLTENHSFTFPSGTTLQPNSFRAFYSSDTALSLSNTAGQAVLLDPFGTAIATTAAYGTAKDGYAWALAKGTWYWTTQPTPGAANIIKQPSSKSAKSSATKKKVTSKPQHNGGSATLTSSSADGTGQSETSAPIHFWVLAAIVMAALLYGAYEYRHDLANRLLQLRANYRARRAYRQTAKGGRSD